MNMEELAEIGREIERHRIAGSDAMEALVAGTMTAEQAETKRKRLMQANQAIKDRLKALILRDYLTTAGQMGRMVKALEACEQEAERDRSADEQNYCQKCGRRFMWRNVGRDHYCCCDTCKTADWAGSNLFSNWRDEDPSDWELNKEILKGYRQA